VTGFVLDEHLPTWWSTAVRRLQPAITVWRIGDGIAPPLRTPDPDILVWCTGNDACLLTNNRTSMPGHLAAHAAAGLVMPGIFQVDPRLDVNILANSLALLAGAALPGEFDNLISYLPLIVP
jgi:hypothetical protein